MAIWVNVGVNNRKQMAMDGYTDTNENETHHFLICTQAWNENKNIVIKIKIRNSITCIRFVLLFSLPCKWHVMLINRKLNGEPWRMEWRKKMRKRKHVTIDYLTSCLLCNATPTLIANNQNRSLIVEMKSNINIDYGKCPQFIYISMLIKCRIVSSYQITSNDTRSVIMSPIAMDTLFVQ